MAQNYLRPAAVKAGIPEAEDRRGIGFHNLRHSLASYLVTHTKTDVKTVQSMLRHANIGTTLDLYRHGLIPGTKEGNPVRLSRCPVSSSYEAVVVSPEQMIVMLNELDTPETQCEWTLALLHAATGMRPEEAFGLKWSDVNWEKGQIHINRAWSKGKETAGKTKESMTQVVMSPTLAEALKRWQKLTLYGEPTDWVFASTKKKGKIPRSASTCGKKYLRPAAIAAGVIPKDYKGRFGWHNMRHSLATFLAGEVDSSVTMKMLRHKKLSTTLEVYSHSVNSKQGEAQQKYLSAIGLQLVSGKSTGSEVQKQRA